MKKGLIPAKYTSYVVAFYMAGFMAFLMSMVLVAINTGVGDGYVKRVLFNYSIAMPIAFVCVILIRPIVTKLTNLTVKH
ncbi:DUF2798 domain-containing protein [Ursidibacter sp. B-7004-1]